MSEIMQSNKSTLQGLLLNPQSNIKSTQMQQKIVFPKINTKLKKTLFTKYHSAFISAKSCNIQSSLQKSQKLYNKQIGKKINTQNKQLKNAILKQEKIAFCKSNNQCAKSVWKLNLKHYQFFQKKNQKVYDKLYPIKNINRKIQNIQQQKEKEKQRKNVFKDLKNNQHQNKQQSSDQNQNFLINETRKNNSTQLNIATTQRSDNLKLRTFDQINQNINRSNKIISLIKKNRKQGFFQSIQEQQNQSSLKNIQSKLGLFSYLKRNFVTKKQALTPQKIKQYFSSGFNSKLQAKISQVSRSFLQQKLHNDYKSYRQVQDLRHNMSEQAIQQQIQQKNHQFHKEYNKKYFVPYVSFLSLPKKTKLKVLKNITNPDKRSQRKFN